MSEENHPLVSVIIPVYNTEKYLDKCLTSVRQQTLKNIEIICVDDGSTDKSIEIIYKHANEDDRIKTLFEYNKSSGYARNKGMEIATGEYICFVDSDDWIKKTCIEKAYRLIKENDFDIGIFKYKCFDDVFRTLSKENLGFNTQNEIILKSKEETYSGLFSLTTATVWNKIYKKDFIVNNNIKFDEIRGFDDVTFSFVSLAAAESIGFLNEPLYVYRVNRIGSIMKNLDKYKFDSTYALESLKKNLKSRNIYEVNVKEYDYIVEKLKKHKQDESDTNVPAIKVTSIITSFNQKEYIEEAVKSAINQKGNFIHEILIADDGSTDGTKNILNEYIKKYPDLIKDISNESNVGISKNMNNAIEKATGKYLCFLEGDDIWFDEYKISKQVEFLESNNDCSMVFSDIKKFYQTNNKYDFSGIQKNAPTKISLEYLINKVVGFNCLLNFSCCMFKTNIMKNLPKSLFVRRFSEVPLQFVLLKYGLIGHIKESSSIYRIHDNGVWSGLNSFEKIMESIACLKSCMDYCGEKEKNMIKDYILNVKLQNNIDKLKDNEKKELSNYVQSILNEKKISFSIIMPTYNRKNFIDESIQSILNQTYDNYELIIVDDGSTDGTCEYIKEKYKKQLNEGKIILHELSENSGASVARNEGLKIAKNEWIAYCDSDNKWDELFLQDFYYNVQSNPNESMFYCKIFNILKKEEIGKEFSYEDLYKRNFIDMNGFVHSKEMYLNYGGFDINLKRLIDYDLILKYTEHKKPFFINKSLVYYNDRNHKRISNSESYSDSIKRIKEKYKFMNN